MKLQLKYEVAHKTCNKVQNRLIDLIKCALPKYLTVVEDTDMQWNCRPIS